MVMGWDRMGWESLGGVGCRLVPSGELVVSLQLLLPSAVLFALWSKNHFTYIPSAQCSLRERDPDQGYMFTHHLKRQLGSGKQPLQGQRPAVDTFSCDDPLSGPIRHARYTLSLPFEMRKEDFSISLSLSLSTFP